MGLARAQVLGQASIRARRGLAWKWGAASESWKKLEERAQPS